MKCKQSGPEKISENPRLFHSKRMFVLFFRNYKNGYHCVLSTEREKFIRYSVDLFTRFKRFYLFIIIIIFLNRNVSVTK